MSRQEYRLQDALLGTGDRAKYDRENPMNLKGVAFCVIATIVCIVLFYTSVMNTNITLAIISGIGVIVFPYLAYTSFTGSLAGQILSEL